MVSCGQAAHQLGQLPDLAAHALGLDALLVQLVADLAQPLPGVSPVGNQINHDLGHGAPVALRFHLQLLVNDCGYLHRSPVGTGWHRFPLSYYPSNTWYHQDTGYYWGSQA